MHFYCAAALLLLSVAKVTECSSISNDDILDITGQLFDISGNFGDSFVLNLQGETTSSETTDRAPERLITSLDESVLKAPTIQALQNLYNNYEADENIPEDVTRDEEAEINEFLDEIMKTETMQAAHNFLAEKGEVSSDAEEFKAFLKQIWFDLYERNHELSSSGFEHVFIGEKDGSKVGGFHNWVRYYQQELEGEVDYQGYITEAKVEQMNIITYRMNWGSAKKPINTGLFGTYPEYELATLTICWVARPNQQCTVRLTEETDWKIQTYVQTYNNKQYVGSAYFI